MAPTRTEALAVMLKELDDAVVIGPKTNLAFLRRASAQPEVAAGAVDTGFIDANLAPRRAAAPAGQARRPRRGALLLDEGDRREPDLAARAVRSVGRRPIRSNLSGPRRLGLDVDVDGKPERLHLVGGDQCRFADGGRRSRRQRNHALRDRWRRLCLRRRPAGVRRTDRSVRRRRGLRKRATPRSARR